MRYLVLLIALAACGAAQSLVTIAGTTDFRDTQLHLLTGSCVAVPQSVTAPPLFVVPASFVFSVTQSVYNASVLPGTYSVSCTVSYGAKTISVGMNWLVPSTGGPYTVGQVATTTPSGQQFTVLAQQLADGGNLNDVLTRDPAQPTGAKWAAPTGGSGSGVTWNGSSVTWP